MKQFLVLLFVLMNTRLIAQDTLFLDAKRNEVSSMSLSKYYKVVYVNKEDVTIVTEKLFDTKTGILLAEQGFYRFSNKKYQDGVERKWDKSGQLIYEAFYKIDKLNGKEIGYYPNGNIKRRAEYSNGVLLEGKCYTADGRDTIFYAYKEGASFPGGEKAMYEYIKKEIRYPAVCKKKKLEGRVLCVFIIEKDGSISNVTVDKGSGVPELDVEAVRVISEMPKWKPAIFEGRFVKIKFAIPVVFKLSE